MVEKSLRNYKGILPYRQKYRCYAFYWTCFPTSHKYPRWDYIVLCRIFAWWQYVWLYSFTCIYLLLARCKNNFFRQVLQISSLTFFVYPKYSYIDDYRWFLGGYKASMIGPPDCYCSVSLLKLVSTFFSFSCRLCQQLWFNFPHCAKKMQLVQYHLFKRPDALGVA
jgi:hypothetical protein